MNYPELQNHKWAFNLGEALKYFRNSSPSSGIVGRGDSSSLVNMYRGNFDSERPYPGLKLLAAFWISEFYEMKTRLSILTEKLGIADDEKFQELWREYFKRYQEDFSYYIDKYDLLRQDKLDTILTDAMNGDGVPDDWDVILNELNEKTNNAIEGLYIFDDRLFEKWIELCSRMILGYSRNLIKQAVIAGLFVLENGKEEIEKQIGKSYEWFSWGINRIFYKEVLPRAGVVELTDVMDLGSYGMLSDQDISPSVSEKAGECVTKKSFLLTCQLYGIFSSVEKWMGLENGDLTPAYCPFCIGHGEKTMFFVVPPDMKLSYKLTEGLGYGGKMCEFTLQMEPAEDYERADNAQMIIFGDDDIEV